MGAKAMSRPDIAIVGAGLAGSTAAAMLARAGRDFLIVDPHPRCNWDFRVEKLDPSHLEDLRKTGLAECVLPKLTPGTHQWMVRLGRFVHKRTTEQYGFYYDGLVNIFRDLIPTERFVQEKVTAIKTSNDRQTLTLSNGEEISARLVVLATGPNHTLRESLGIERNVLNACHSVGFGYDIKPTGHDFDFDALTFFPENPHDPISYLTLFRVGAIMRANLFVYRELKDPWLRIFRDAPKETALAALPGLRNILGDHEVVGRTKLRPVELYETAGHVRPGVVLVGDAFATSCPAAGTGSNKVFTDVERLCNHYIPRWLATRGMDSTKIAMFYADPEKRACDAESRARALDMRALAVDDSMRWRLQRLLRRARGYGRGALEYARAAASVHPKLAPIFSKAASISDRIYQRPGHDGAI
jgi:2-polyprenyl-6-methoxyphenol hydroxylase-like FAD-dependent oxidoreductase